MLKNNKLSIILIGLAIGYAGTAQIIDARANSETTRFSRPEALQMTEAGIWANPHVYLKIRDMRLATRGEIRPTTPKHRGNMIRFLNAIAYAESDNNPYEINPSGHIGKYQFSPRTLAALGFSGPQSEFLENESIQDSMMIVNLKRNAFILRKVISTTNDTWYNGVYVTTSGILAAAHLVGPGGVLAYFYPDKYDAKLEDGNGTHMLTYLRRFSNYSISL